MTLSSHLGYNGCIIIENRYALIIIFSHTLNQYTDVTMCVVSPSVHFKKAYLALRNQNWVNIDAHSPPPTKR